MAFRETGRRVVRILSSHRRGWFLALVMCSESVAIAGPPDPGNSSVPTGIYLVGSRAGVPDPAGLFTIVVRDNANLPVASTPVSLDFSGAPDLVLGSVQPYPGVSVTCNSTISTTTDANGVATLIVLGSGAGRFTAAGTVGPAVQVRAGPGNTLLGTIAVAAFDLDGINGVDYDDIALWQCDFGSGAGFARSDYDFFGGIGISDLSRLLSAFTSGSSRDSAVPCVGGSPPAPVMMSAGIGLGWNDCRSVAGIDNMTFACNVNTGTPFHLIGSLNSPAEITGISRIETEIEVVSTSGPLPAWWRTAPGGCRSGAMASADPLSSASITCTVAGQASSISTITGGDASVQRLHITTPLQGNEVTLAAADETALLDLTINRTKSTGAGSCADCASPVLIRLLSMRLVQGDACSVAPTSRPPDVVFHQMSGTNIARWQGAAPAFGIAIDATALSDPDFRVSGGGCRDGSVVQDFLLAAGSYTFSSCSGTGITFSVDGSGLVQYSPTLEGVLGGAGTNTLVVHGAQVTVDLTQASDASYQIDSLACFPRSQVQSLRLGPGGHVVRSCAVSCAALSSVGFSIDDAGLVAYDPMLEGALNGAGSTALVVKSASFPPAGDDLAPSMGLFRVVVEPEFWDLMAGYPGYAVVNGVHRLVSPVLYDAATRVGRSTIHQDGDAADVSGVPVGTAGTVVSDANFAIVPPGFAGPAGTAEVHTEIRSLNMTGPMGAAVRAGTFAPDRPISPGEIEANPGVSGLFPAESFFNVNVEVDLPTLGTLYNSDPLLVENFGVECFPPQVVYLHKHTGPVPIHFKVADTQVPARWAAGQRFGWLVLAGHGMNFDANPGPAATKSGARKTATTTDPFAEFAAIVNAEPEMADRATIVVDVKDVVTFASPSAFTDPAYADSLENGINLAAALGEAGNPCAGLFQATRMYQRVDSLTSVPDWVTDHTVRRVLADRFLAMSTQLLAQANQTGGCPGTTNTPPKAAPSSLALLGIQPNPSFGRTSIRYAVPKGERVSLMVFDVSGRHVRTLVDGELPAGTYEAVWDGHQDRAGGRAASSGNYFIRLSAGGKLVTRRMTLIR